MKAKYKLDQFVQFSVTGGSEYGVVTGVIKRKEGFFYEVHSNGTDTHTVQENEVLSAYRPVAARKVAQPKKKATKSRSTKFVQDTDEGAAA